MVSLSSTQRQLSKVLQGIIIPHPQSRTLAKRSIDILNLYAEQDAQEMEMEAQRDRHSDDEDGHETKGSLLLDVPSGDKSAAAVPKVVIHPEQDEDEKNIKPTVIHPTCLPVY